MPSTTPLFDIRSQISPGSQVLPDPMSDPFDPMLAPPTAPPAFGLSNALDPEAFDFSRAGMSTGTPPNILQQLLKAILSMGKTGGRPTTFAAEMPSKPWGVRYDTPGTRDFGGGSPRQSARGFASESGRQG